MEKRYQVFVSSTYEDLQEERREVMQALLRLKCIPTGMELFPGADDDAWTVIRRFISECDYFIVIVGGRYGSRGKDRKSYTAMEYDLAVETGVPILALLHKDPGQIPANKTEATDEGKAALAAFRKRIEGAKHPRYWTSPKELAGEVALSLPTQIEFKPRPGWVRADSVPDESAAQEILRLKRQVEELETKLAAAATTPPAGTEELAQGEETIHVRFRYEYGSEFLDAKEDLSWSSIVATVGPALIGDADEDEIKKKLAEAFKNRLKDKKGIQVFSAYMRDEDFQRIKIQLRALGIIRETGPDLPSGNIQWGLTPYGDRLVTQIVAIRSSKKA